MRRSPAPVLAALVAVLLLAGCSGGSDSAESAAAPAMADGGDDAARGDVALGKAGGTAEALTSTGGGAPTDGGTLLQGRALPGRALVRTAELTVEVDDVRPAAERATAAVRAAGGTVELEERSAYEQEASALLVVRVPPDAFDPLLGRLAELGEERDRRLGTSDVTDEVVDLDARIATQRASVARVRALLDRATGIGEIVQIEGELTERTADLEALQARLAALEQQVDRSTITLRLVDDDAVVGSALGFGDGLAAGWDALVSLGRAAGVTLGALLPFTPLLLLVVLAWRLRSRRTPTAA